MILSLGQHTLLQKVSVMKMLRLVEMQVNDFEKQVRSQQVIKMGCSTLIKTPIF